MARLQLRDYQAGAVQAHYDFFAKRDEGNPLIVVPTGGGKSLILAEFIVHATANWPDTRIVCVTHVKELIEQNFDEFCAYSGASPWAPGLRSVGIYSAGLGRRDVNAQILFAGIQSIWNKATELGHVDLVLIDEVHLLPPAGEGRYRTFLAELLAINPKLRVVGYTATHYRLDGGYLHKGEGRMFTDVAYEVPVDLLIERGYLVPPVAKQPDTVIDLSKVRRRAGEFRASDVEDAALPNVQEAVGEAVEIAHAEGRQSWLFFGATKKHARAIVDELNGHGEKAMLILGDTPKEERRIHVRRFREGKLRALVNVNVLTTGFNAPRCDMIALMRATDSAALYVQIIGRGMRTFPGKENVLLLDYGRNVERHGPINNVKPRGTHGEKDEDAVAPMKVCPKCKGLVLLAIYECPQCGHEFDPPEPSPLHDKKAGTTSPFDPEAKKPRVYNVSRVFYRRGVSKGRQRVPYLRVDYACGMKIFRKPVCFEHTGYARQKAVQWWGQAGGAAPAPSTVEEAMLRARELRQPSAIEITDDGKFVSVTRTFYPQPSPEPTHERSD